MDCSSTFPAKPITPSRSTPGINRAKFAKGLRASWLVNATDVAISFLLLTQFLPGDVLQNSDPHHKGQQECGDDCPSIKRQTQSGGFCCDLVLFGHRWTPLQAA